VLHDQGAGQGDGSGARGLLRHRRGARGLVRAGQPAGPRHPRDGVPAGGGRRDRRAVRAPGGGVSPRGRILIVDDDPDVIALLQEELEEAGFEVASATSGRDALRAAAAQPVDAVVTDLVMPEMRGEELMSELHAALPAVPVVIMTAFGTIES